MNTRKRPAIVTCEVSRAPFVPSGSFTTWTRTSWPAFNSVSIVGWSPLPRPPPDSAASPPSSSSSPPSIRSKASIVSTTSDTYRKPSRSRPMSTNADCMPGSTFDTRPL